jgi:hypothetical protein
MKTISNNFMAPPRKIISVESCATRVPQKVKGCHQRLYVLQSAS